MAAKKRVVDKFKRKTRYAIQAPPSFGRRVLGQTLALKPQHLVGRVLRVSRDQLGGGRHQRHLQVSFKIVSVSGTTAATELVEVRADGGFLSRLVRRKCSKVAVHLLLSFKDKKKARVSLVSVTQRKVEREKARALRRALADRLAAMAASSTFEAFLEHALSEAFAKALHEAQKPIAPVKRTEVAKIRLVAG